METPRAAESTGADDLTARPWPLEARGTDAQDHAGVEAGAVISQACATSSQGSRKHMLIPRQLRARRMMQGVGRAM